MSFAHIEIRLSVLNENKDEAAQACMWVSGWYGCISRRSDLMEMSRAAVASSEGWTGCYNVSHFTSTGMTASTKICYYQSNFFFYFLNGIRGLAFRPVSLLCSSCRTKSVCVCVCARMCVRVWGEKKEGQNGPLEKRDGSFHWVDSHIVM